MRFELIELAERHWAVREHGKPEQLAEVFRRQTGYLVRMSSGGPEPVKRFRLIDALNQAFGPGHTFDLPDTTKPTEEGFV